MSQVLAELPLDDTLQAALIGGAGACGETLRCALACECCDFEHAQLPGLSAATVNAIYREALLWAEEHLPSS